MKDIDKELNDYINNNYKEDNFLFNELNFIK
jgi:hypothetical protein